MWDLDDRPPAPETAGLAAESGRGLLLVETLSSHWFAAASASGARSPGSLVKIRSPALASRFLAAYSGLTREAYELDLRRDALTDRPRRTERAVMCRHWPRAGPRTQRFLCRLRAAARGWLEREWAVIDHALHHDGGR